MLAKIYSVNPDKPDGMISCNGGRGTVAEPEQEFSRSAMKSVKANINRIREAMNYALLNHDGVHRAMYRNDIGWIDFAWGNAKRELPISLHSAPQKTV